jgi:RNA polymerase alpha subunit/peptidase S24-like protein
MSEHPILPRVVPLAIVGHSMEPVLCDGEIALVDTARTSPAFRGIVVIRIQGHSSIVGYWMTRDFACLGKANSSFEPVILDVRRRWEVAGTVLAVIQEHDTTSAEPPRDERRIKDVLTLSPRAINRLDFAGIRTIGELLRHSAKRLGMIKGLGAKTLREILEDLARAGLVLPDH